MGQAQLLPSASPGGLHYEVRRPVRSGFGTCVEIEAQAGGLCVLLWPNTWACQ